MGRGRGHLPSTYGFRGGAKDLLMNQNVVITRGQNKGKWGIVKECTDQTIRVEIHSSGKVVSIERDSCSVKTPTGNVPASVFAPLTPSAITMDYGPTFTQSTSTYSSPVVAQNTYTRMPAFAPRTPAYGMGNATPFIPYGGQTPAAWDIGARTPAPASAQEQAGLWAQTPAYPSMGAKTPAYQPNQDNGSW
jgi:transcription elongation factor SPT5